MIDGGHVASAPLPTLHACYFGQESGGQSGLTFIGVSPLCTCGAAEFVPPASRSTALFSTAGAGPRDDTATRLAWFPLEVAAPEILQAQQERLRRAGAPASAIENGIETSDPWGTKLRLIKV